MDFLPYKSDKFKVQEDKFFFRLLTDNGASWGAAIGANTLAPSTRRNEMKIMMSYSFCYVFRVEDHCIKLFREKIGH